MERVKVTDDEIVVDSMILACKGEKENPALPSFGRNLVPYFCPTGSVDPTEEDINVATDVDAYRRGGASILDIPAPESTKGPVKKGPLKKNNRQAAKGGSIMPVSEPLKVRKRGALSKGKEPSPRDEEVSSPTSPLDEPAVLTGSSDSDVTDSEQRGKGRTWQQEHLQQEQRQRSPSKPKRKVAKCHPSSEIGQQGARALNSQSSLPSTKAKSDSGSGSDYSPTKLPERFAGAAFHNSPAPSCLPLPTFMVQKPQDKPPSLPSKSSELLPSPTVQRIVRAPSESALLHVDQELATLKLRELLKLGSPPPVQTLNEHVIATRDLRRILQLA